MQRVLNDESKWLQLSNDVSQSLTHRVKDHPLQSPDLGSQRVCSSSAASAVVEWTAALEVREGSQASTGPHSPRPQPVCFIPHTTRWEGRGR